MAIAPQPARAAACIAAGETTVTVAGHGLGGRNQEFALAARPVVARSAGPPCSRARARTASTVRRTPPGRVVDSTTSSGRGAAGLDWESTLAANDAYHFFAPLGDLIVWGPTGTNVGDVQMLLMA